ncbi:MAG: family transcriptional regulator [Thermoleophilia bacterium]|nr:family transcriptional regulator [Thermoleophilia bacterium]
MPLDPRDRRDIRRVADTLVAERNRHRLTQEDVAASSGVSLSTIQRMEEGTTDCGLSKYLRVARAIGIDPRDLLDRLDPVE